MAMPALNASIHSRSFVTAWGFCYSTIYILRVVLEIDSTREGTLMPGLDNQQLAPHSRAIEQKRRCVLSHLRLEFLLPSIFPLVHLRVSVQQICEQSRGWQ